MCQFLKYCVYYYTYNNPVMLVDPDGRKVIDYFNKQGDKIGTNGDSNDKRSFVVSDKKEIKAIKKNEKIGRGTELNSLKSARLSPRKTSLITALGDLNATIEANGMKERASITFNEGTSVSRMGPIGVQNGGNVTAEANLPSLPNGYSSSDIESISHSHLTAMFEYDGIPFVGGNALDPTIDDKNGVFKMSPLNIISGPLGTGNFTRIEGELEFTPPVLGLVIYRYGKVQYMMTKEAVENMIKQMQ